MTIIFDAHLHIINPNFPLIENDGYLPPDFLVEDYLKRASNLSAQSDLDIQSGVIVSGSFQGFDQSYLLNALMQLNANETPLNPDFVGVTQIPASATEKELLYLHQHGVRAVRFNLKRGGSESVKELERVALRIHDLMAWHVELYAGYDALVSLKNILPKLPAVSVDHLGLEQRSLPMLRKLVEQGVKVKATGFGRLDFEPISVIKELYAIEPTALMFGSDLPSTRAPKPFENVHLIQLKDQLGPKAMAQICWHNGRSFYGLDSGSGPKGQACR